MRSRCTKSFSYLRICRCIRFKFIQYGNDSSSGQFVFLYEIGLASTGYESQSLQRNLLILHLMTVGLPLKGQPTNVLV